MSIQAATAYLNLNGRADEAITHYGRALGATVQTLMRFGDMDPRCPEARRQSVMHAVLTLDGGTVMLSDGDSDGTPPGMGPVSVALSMNDPAQAHHAIGVLGEGGHVMQPLIDAPWGALFGMVSDKFGVHWMLNCEKPAS
jgi:PhnB protein